MKGTILTILFGVLLNSTVLAQEDFSMGLLIDDEAFEQTVEMIPAFSNDGRRAADLPRKFSLRLFTPFPKNQGSINSCIGWAMGYAALTTQKAFREGISDRMKITKEAHSAMYIYNQVKEGSCMSGAYVHKAAEFLKDKGTCFSEEFDFPYSECDRTPEPILVAQSQQYSIKDFVGLFKKGDPAKVKVMRTKRSIAEGKPVVIGMRIKESLKRVSKRKPQWKPGAEFDKILGGHALCVVGYNDSLGVFEIMNSWGSTWGDGGYFRIGYRDYSEMVFQGIQLVLPDLALTEEQLAAHDEKRLAAFAKLEAARAKKRAAMENKKMAIQARAIVEEAPVQQDSKEQQNAAALLEQAQALIQQAEAESQIAETEEIQAEQTIIEAELTTAALAGDFMLRMPRTDEFGTLITDEHGQAIWREVQPILRGSHYELEKRNWDEGDMFQVIAKNIKKDSYVYLFSLDGNNKAEIHWPRNHKFRENLRGKEGLGKGEGALVTHSGAEIMIPGHDRVLVRENLLDDHILVLYSDIRIDDFKDRVLKMRDECVGPFNDRLKQAFGDLLIPTERIVFEENKMRCRTENLEEGKVIPVVVRMTNEQE